MCARHPPKALKTASRHTFGTIGAFQLSTNSLVCIELGRYQAYPSKIGVTGLPTSPQGGAILRNQYNFNFGNVYAHLGMLLNEVAGDPFPIPMASIDTSDVRIQNILQASAPSRDPLGVRAMLCSLRGRPGFCWQSRAS